MLVNSLAKWHVSVLRVEACKLELEDVCYGSDLKKTYYTWVVAQALIPTRKVDDEINKAPFGEPRIKPESSVYRILLACTYVVSTQVGRNIGGCSRVRIIL